jgi:vesicle transport protein SEC22
MLILTMIARLRDALPLAASASDDNQTIGRSLVDYQNQAKLLFRKMNASSPIRGSIESGAYLFQFVVNYRINSFKNAFIFFIYFS